MRHLTSIAAVLIAELALPAAPAMAGTATPHFAHIVIVLQENRTPDNLFGSNPSFEPGVDIAASGNNGSGTPVPLSPVPLATCYDPNHSHNAFVTMYDGGKLDGGDRNPVALSGVCAAPLHPTYAYADNSTGTVQPYFDIATNYGFANRMFQTNQGPSFPAHQFMFGGTAAPTASSSLQVAENMMLIGSPAGCTADAGQRVAVIDTTGSETRFPPVYPCFDRSTLSTLLDNAGLSWTYYINFAAQRGSLGSIWNAPAATKAICGAQKQAGHLTCAGSNYTSHVTWTQSQVLADITNCNLPAVSWVIPNGRDSDHPTSTGGTGPAWVASIVNAIGNQAACPSGETYWNDTAIIITWDDWGGFYDHVAPYTNPAYTAAPGGPKGLTYGFRVPLMVVSAYTPAGYVDNDPHDFGSILRLVEDNFGLGRIGSGTYSDAYATSLAAFFGLSSPRAFTPISTPLGMRYFMTAPAPAGDPDDE